MGLMALHWQLSTYRHRVSFINLELSRFVLIATHPSREEAQEGPEQVKVLTSHIRHLEDGTNPTIKVME